tara:strand:+ start:172 stop:390 length:219 start_codon:yes stop_codon:yes gene_type:complete
MAETITDKTEALVAVKNSAWALEDLSDELKADKEVVLAAAQENISAIDYASDELKTDPEILDIRDNSSFSMF